MMMIALDSVCDMPAAKADAPVSQTHTHTHTRARAHTHHTELQYMPHDTHDTHDTWGGTDDGVGGGEDFIDLVLREERQPIGKDALQQLARGAPHSGPDDQRRRVEAARNRHRRRERQTKELRSTQ
jgi:hypothetical protein